MASPVATKRLTKEFISIQKNPPPFICAHPLESNILEWHYLIEGPPDSPYEGGVYHGVLLFPTEYPFKPPAIKMFTPNGRFQTNFRLCLTMSDYHPSTWNPAWSVATILTGLLSFMLEDTPTTGSINTSAMEKRRLAKQSRKWNLSNHIFCRLFPKFIKSIPVETPSSNFHSVNKSKSINLLSNNHQDIQENSLNSQNQNSKDSSNHEKNSSNNKTLLYISLGVIGILVFFMMSSQLVFEDETYDHDHQSSRNEM